MAARIIYLPDVTDSPSAERVELFAGEPDVFGVAKAAQLLDVSAATIRRLIASGALECVHVGTRVRVTKTALLRFIGE